MEREELELIMLERQEAVPCSQWCYLHARTSEQYFPVMCHQTPGVR